MRRVLETWIQEKVKPFPTTLYFKPEYEQVRAKVLFDAKIPEAKLKNLNDALQTEIEPLNLKGLRFNSHGSEWSGRISEQNVQDLIEWLRSCRVNTTNLVGPTVGNKYSTVTKLRNKTPKPEITTTISVEPIEDEKFDELSQGLDQKVLITNEVESKPRVTVEARPSSKENENGSN